jgi:hypothetical protein
VTSLVLALISPPQQKDPPHHWHLHFFGGQNVWPKKNPLNVAAEVQHPDFVVAKTFYT